LEEPPAKKKSQEQRENEENEKKDFGFRKEEKIRIMIPDQSPKSTNCRGTG
jgi:hypothetical protein